MSFCFFSNSFYGDSVLFIDHMANIQQLRMGKRQLRLRHANMQRPHASRPGNMHALRNLPQDDRTRSVSSGGSTLHPLPCLPPSCSPSSNLARSSACLPHCQPGCGGFWIHMHICMCFPPVLCVDVSIFGLVEGLLALALATDHYPSSLIGVPHFPGRGMEFPLCYREFTALADRRVVHLDCTPPLHYRRGY